MERLSSTERSDERRHGKRLATAWVMCVCVCGSVWAHTSKEHSCAEKLQTATGNLEVERERERVCVCVSSSGCTGEWIAGDSSGSKSPTARHHAGSWWRRCACNVPYSSGLEEEGCRRIVWRRRWWRTMWSRHGPVFFVCGE